MEGVAEITMERNRHAPTKLEKISFGLGDFANNGMFSFVSTYAMFYYTDIAKVSLEAVAAILLIYSMIISRLTLLPKHPRLLCLR